MFVSRKDLAADS